MTNLQAIRSAVNFPLDDLSFEKVLLDRGFDPAGTYAPSAQFKLAVADAIVVVVTSPNISEGGYSISQNDRESLINLANSYYASGGEDSPFSPVVSTFRPW